MGGGAAKNREGLFHSLDLLVTGGRRVSGTRIPVRDSSLEVN